MSTTPQPQPTLEQSLLSHVQTLSQHTVRVSYTFIGIIVLLIAMMGAGGYLGFRSWSTMMAQAEAREAVFDANVKSFQQQLAQHDAERAQDQQQIADLQEQIAARARAPLPPVIQKGLLENANAQQTAAALGAVLSPSHPGYSPMATADGKVALSVPDAQETASDVLAGDRAKSDLIDLNKVVDLEKQDNLSISKDLGQCKTELTQATGVIAGYKKLAVRSKWSRILSGAEKAGLVVFGAAIGHAI